MKTNNLVENLKGIQKRRHLSLSCFSKLLGIPNTTLQSIMVTGNTTLYTVICIANHLNMSLDSLVFGKIQESGDLTAQELVCLLDKYKNLSPEKRAEVQFHLVKLVKLLDSSCEGTN